MLTLSDCQTFLPPCILSAADNADWCRKTRTAVSQLSLLLKHHIIAVTFCLPPRRAVVRSLVPPLTPTYTKVYATSCYYSQSRDILGCSRVQKSWNEVFFKILKEPSIVQKILIPHIKGLDFSQRWSKKKFKMADLENSKWPPQKHLIFQLHQFSIFFHENFMDWSSG